MRSDVGGQTDQTQGVFHPSVDFIVIQSHVARTECDILLDRLAEQLIFRILEQQSDVEAHIAQAGFALKDVLAVEQHGAAGRTEQAVEVLDERGLARTGVTDERDKFTALDREIDIIQRLVLKRRADAVQMGQVSDLKNRCGFTHARTPPSSR